MDGAKALQAIRSAGQLFLTKHARDRMAQRNVSYKDVQHALQNASHAELSDDDDGYEEKWVVRGADIDGDELYLVVIIEEILVGGVRNVVVTVY